MGKMGKMGRRPWYDKNGMKKGAWSQEEDEKLRSYIQKYGHWNWSQLPKFAGLSRCGKSCRLRWMNYLRQNIKRGNFSKEEDDLIIKLQDEHGNKWANIATKLPGRTDNEIKNYWHSNLKRHGKQKSSMSKIIKNFCENSISEARKKESTEERVDANNALSQLSSEGCSNFSESSSNGLYSSNFGYALLSDINWFAEGNSICSVESYSKLIDNFWTEPFLSEKTYNQIDFQSASTLKGEFMSASVSYFDDDIQFSNQILMPELS